MSQIQDLRNKRNELRNEVDKIDADITTLLKEEAAKKADIASKVVPGARFDRSGTVAFIVADAGYPTKYRLAGCEKDSPAYLYSDPPMTLREMQEYMASEWTHVPGKVEFVPAKPEPRKPVTGMKFMLDNETRILCSEDGKWVMRDTDGKEKNSWGKRPTDEIGLDGIFQSPGWTPYKLVTA